MCFYNSLKYKFLNHRLVVFAFFLIIIPAEAKTRSFRETIYEAYISGDMDLWERTLKERLTASLDPEGWYETAMACYGFIGYCLSREEKARARPYLDQAEEIAGKLLAENPQDPRFVALRGALYGFRFIYQPQKIMIIGPKALNTINRAMELGPDCPQAWIEAGNKDWWMPAIFGGSRERAVEEYEKAILMIENDRLEIKNNWYYLNIQMVLAGWYKERNMTFRAREVYRKILAAEPRFNWASEMLSE